MEQIRAIVLSIATVIGTMYDWLIAHQPLILALAYGVAATTTAAILLRAWQGKYICRGGRLYQIAVPQGAAVQPFAAEQMFATLRGLQEHWWRRLWNGPEHISLEIAADRSGVRFYLWAPERIAETVLRTIHAAYEQADIRPVEQDYLLGPGTDALGLPHHFPAVRRWGNRIQGARLQLLRDIALPIKTLREFEKTDPLAGITAAMAGLQEGAGALVQVLIQPGGEWEIAARSKTGIARIERGRSFNQPSPDGRSVLRAFREYTPEEKQQVIAMGGKRAKLTFRVALRVLTIAPSRAQAYARLRGLAASFEQFNVAILNGWRRRTIWFATRASFVRHIRSRHFPLWGTRKAHHPLVGEHDVLNIEELSTIWHLPNPEVVETPGIVWSLSRKRAGGPLQEGTVTDGLVVARTSYRGEHTEIALPARSLFTHVSVIGLPGSGKTTLLARVFLECIKHGIAVILLDPHGDLCESLLPRIPVDVHDRVIYFNPARDLDRPMGLNFLEPEPGQHPAQVKSEVVTMLTHLFGQELIGPRSSYVLAHCIQTLQDIGGMTLLEIKRLLVDESFRETAILCLYDPSVQEFWYRFFKPLVQKNARMLMEVISPVINKIAAFASDNRVANVVGQTVSSFRLREVMDSGKILLCNLSQGGLGADNSRLLGGAIASRVVQAALTRENEAEADRKPAVLIADEFHIFVGPQFPEALAQVRKYRLGLVLACQMLSQLDAIPGMRPAFLSAGTRCVFRVVAEDAVQLASAFTHFFSAEDLVRLDPYQVAIHTTTGRETIPFSGETIPLEEGTSCRPEQAEALRQAVRERYGRPVDEVKEEMRKRGDLQPVTRTIDPPKRSSSRGKQQQEDLHSGPRK